MGIERAVKGCKAGKAEYRVETAGSVHAPVGKLSFEADKLCENIWTERGYRDGWLPVLHMRQVHHAISVRETAFAHMPRGERIVRGDEPMYLWVAFEAEKDVPFQTIEQDVTLPEGFQAFEAEVQVRSSKLRFPMQQSFPWKAGEAPAA